MPHTMINQILLTASLSGPVAPTHSPALQFLALKCCATNGCVCYDDTSVSVTGKLSKRDLLYKIQPDRMQALAYICKIITSF